MRVFFKIVGEGFWLALQELWGNKLRTLLSVLGITIGIFCVISVLMMIDSVERSLRNSLQKLGDDVIYIDRFPWDGGDGQWWEYIKRPFPGYRDYVAIEDRSTTISKVAIRIVLMGKELKTSDVSIQNVNVGAGTHHLGDIFNFEYSSGRHFSDAESNLGSNVIILGHTLADNLFPQNSNPIGQVVKLMGRKMRVVGVLQKEGKSLLGDGGDELAFIPYNYMRRYIDVNSKQVIPIIAAKAKEGFPLEQAKEELTGILRAQRKLSPREETDFALNQTSILFSVLDNVFAVVNIAGIIIGLFSILVGGFGIANIMFVSVKERTNIIGIKKSLGAKKHFILFEFLIESICLCIMGGLIGLVLVYLASLLANYFVDSLDFLLSMFNVLLGLAISVIIGVVSGFLPALNASNMNPVEAIRQK